MIPSLQLLSFLALCLECSATHAPIHPRKLHQRSPKDLGTWAANERDKVRNRYGFGAPALAKRQSISTTRSTTVLTSHPSPTSAPKLGQEYLVNSEADLEYYVPIHVGTPPTTYNVILDTGSSDLWLASSNCSTCADRSITPNASSTSKDLLTPFAIRYGSGDVSGELWQDNITLAGRNVSYQPFAACDTISSEIVGGNVSGLMGMGFPSLSASGKIPFWQNLLTTATSLPFYGFTFALTRYINITDARSTEMGGLFTLGSIDNSSYNGSINYVDVPLGQESYWVIPMSALSMNGTNHTTLGTPNVAIDTGTTLIGGPSDVVSAFYNMIPGSQPATGAYDGYYTFPCSTPVIVGLTFGNITYNMTSADFNLGSFSSGQCLGSIFDINLSSGSRAVISWVIGTSFLKNVYTVFQYEPSLAVGFARLVQPYQPRNAPGTPPESIKGVLPTATGDFGPGAPSTSSHRSPANPSAEPANQSPNVISAAHSLVPLWTVMAVGSVWTLLQQ